MKISRLAVFVLPLCLMACGDKETSKDDPGGKKAAPAGKQTIADLLGDTKAPALVGHFAKAKFGMSSEELKKVSPAYADKGDFLSAKDFGIGYYASLEGEPKSFEALLLTVAESDVPAIEKAWGKPVAITYRRKPSSLWLNPAAKIKAMGHMDEKDYKLRIEPYLPQAEIVGEPGKPLGIETAKPFLGATPDELKAAYPENYSKNSGATLVFMEWLSDEYGTQFKAQLTIKDGKINRIQFWLHHGDNEDVKKAALALLVGKYGPSSPAKTTLGSDKLKFGDSPVLAGETKGAWVIQITAK